MFLELAQQRRTIYQFIDRKVDSELLNQCLEAAIWAPNHGLTQPWRFYIIGHQTQQKLMHLYAKLRADKRALPGTEEHKSIFLKACDRFKANPQIIMLGQVRSIDSVKSKEDYAACACAIQNFQLAAWEQGLGVQWSTGPVINACETYELLGLNSAEIELVGILYIGYPQCIPESQRQPLSQVTKSYP
ncbi:MAG: nitroreductase [Thiomicrospira sp.]|uniref:nitroreductase family protein n=1 Tax=Thiomicrospira sp. TaxID=935 RepID=UPI0019F12C4F|nr:nitroreductase [Thiomicrospira sp.]MBE0493461.1 nitroreductase [Thiomicrospira sp.]